MLGFTLYIIAFFFLPVEVIYAQDELNKALARSALLAARERLVDELVESEPARPLASSRLAAHP